MDGNDSGLCIMAGFGISDVHHSSPAIRVLVMFISSHIIDM